MVIAHSIQKNRVGFFWLREGDGATFLPLKY